MRWIQSVLNKVGMVKKKTYTATSSMLQVLSPKLGSILFFSLLAVYLFIFTCAPAYAVEDMWTVGQNIIKDIYQKIAGISTVLAGLMSAIAVIGAKMSNNQHKVDNCWDWLKRIWIAWAIINGIGAFLAYVVPLFDGLATLDVPSHSSSNPTA